MGTASCLELASHLRSGGDHTTGGWVALVPVCEQGCCEAARRGPRVCAAIPHGAGSDSHRDYSPRLLTQHRQLRGSETGTQYVSLRQSVVNVIICAGGCGVWNTTEDLDDVILDSTQAIT